MTGGEAAPGGSALRSEDVEERDGLFHTRHGESTYRRVWEAEAAADPIRSATATAATGDGLDALTPKVSALWDRVAARGQLGSVVELGCGYGRIALHLCARRGAQWTSYVGIDISEEMLRQMRTNADRFGLERAQLVCGSIDTLPLRDASVDLVASSAVLLHMGKSYVARTLAESARVLRPGGAFVLETSFPNARNPVNAVTRLKPRRRRPPHFLKYWTRHEIEEALRRSGLAHRGGGVILEPSAYELLPRFLPLSERVNATFRPRLSHLVFSAYSPGAVAA